MSAFDETVKKYTSFLDNEYVSAGLSIFLIIYAGMAAPKLPGYVARLFDYTLVKLLMFFLIVYISRKNATVAIIAAIAVMVSIMTLNRLKFTEMMEVVKGEESGRRVRMNGCVCDCSGQEEGNAEESTLGEELGNYGEERHGRVGVESENKRFVSLQEESENGAEDSSHMSVQEHRAEESRVHAEAEVSGESKSEVSMEEMAEEVKRRASNVGRSLQPEEMKELCSDVLREFRGQTARCQGGCLTNVTSALGDLTGYDGNELHGSI